MDSFYKFSRYIKSAAFSLAANKLRSFLSMIGIVFGIMTVIIIICLGEGTKKEVLRQIELLGIHNIYIRPIQTGAQVKGDKKEFKIGLDASDVAVIKDVSSAITQCAVVIEIPPAVMGEIKEISHQIAAVTPAFFSVLDLKLLSGRGLLELDVTRHHLTAVLGYDTATALGNKAAPGKTIRLGNQIYKIVGILAPFGGKKASPTAISTRNLNEMILIPFGSEKWLGKTVKDSIHNPLSDSHRVSEIIVKTDAADRVAGIAQRIKLALDQKYRDRQNYQIVTPYALLNRSKQMKDTFNLFLIAIASVSLLVGGIGIMNIMLATVLERKKEIGIRRSVGARKKHIMIQFLTESLLLTFAGGIIGILLGVFGVFILGTVAPWPVQLTAGSIFLPLCISSLTGVCSGSYPALKASQIDPVEALSG